MTSIVTSNGQTVVPKKLRKQFKIGTGTTLDWQEVGDSIRVVKLDLPNRPGFLNALRRLGRVPVAPRKKDPVRYTS